MGGLATPCAWVGGEAMAAGLAAALLKLPAGGEATDWDWLGGEAAP